MLLHAVWVKAVDPENRIIDTTTDAISRIRSLACAYLGTSWVRDGGSLHRRARPVIFASEGGVEA
jgi:hypothetical protein